LDFGFWILNFLDFGFLDFEFFGFWIFGFWIAMGEETHVSVFGCDI
jgi:hypothetical protein